jgi:hypothetical protein
MPQSGSGPPSKSDLAPIDNPFPGPNENERLVYAWGLRNPFRFTIDSASGDVFIGSVGSQYYEEVNLAVRSGYQGNNYGWPQHEGPQEIHCCGDCGEGNLFTEPIHVLAHTGPLTAIIGGPRVREVPGSAIGLPAEYSGDYFYVELYSGRIYRLRDTGGTWDHAPAAPGQPDPVAWGTGFYYAADVQQGPDGALYFASLGVNASFPRGIHRVRRADPTGVVATSGSGVGALRVVPNPSRGDVRFSVPSARRERVRVEIVDATGRRVRTLLGSGGGGDGVVWDGRNEGGAPVAPGVYAVRWSGATDVWHGRTIVSR